MNLATDTLLSKGCPVCGLFDHSVLREGEGRCRDLRLGVLAPIGESGKTPDSHDNHAIADANAHARRLLRNLDIDVEPVAHRIDGGLVARVQAGSELPSHRLDLLGRQRLAANHAIPMEHAVCNCEPEVLHTVTPFRRSAPNKCFFVLQPYQEVKFEAF